MQEIPKTPTTGQDVPQQVYHSYIYNNYYCDYTPLYYDSTNSQNSGDIYEINNNEVLDYNN